MLEMFIHNLQTDLSYQIQVQCPISFSKVIEMGLIIEKSLIAKGQIKLYKDTSSTNTNNDKPRFWTKNKNVVNDGVVDAKNVAPKQPIFNLSIPQNNPPQNKPRNTESRFTNFRPRRKFTPLDESLETALRKLITNNLITLPSAREYEPKVKPHWWNDNDFYDYHQNRGHKTNDCISLKHIIQDLIEQNKISVNEQSHGHTSNNDHQAFKDPLPNYE